MKQEIQVRERELRPDNDKGNVNRRCSSFRVTSTPPIDSSKRSSIPNSDLKQHTHIKSKKPTTMSRYLALNCLSGASKE